MAETPYVLRGGDVRSVALDGRDRPGRRVCGGLDCMAIVYDPEEGELIRHGEAGALKAWARRHDPEGRILAVAEFTPTGETLAALNDCLHGLGGPLHFLERLAGMCPGQSPSPPRPASHGRRVRRGRS